MSKDFKEKENLIRAYAKEYNKSKIIEIGGLSLLNKDRVNDTCDVYIDTQNKYTYYFSLQNKIDIIIDMLDWEMADFIKKEFFSNNYKKNWWMNYYSRSTYYRLKNRSMNEFLGLLYD